MGWFSKKTGETEKPTDKRVGDAPTVLSRMAEALHPGMTATDAESLLTRDHAWLTAGGMDLEMRLAVETPLLAVMSPDDLADRFEHTTLPRMDPYPADEIARLEWIEDVLRSERQDVIDGRIGVREAYRIASFPRGPVPAMTAAPSWRPPGIARATDDEITVQAQSMMAMPMKLLMHRFRSVGADLTGPPGSDGRSPMNWIRAALRAEETRRLCRLGAIKAFETSSWSDELVITVSNIEFARLTSGASLFSGDLLVDGQRLCTIQSQTDGSLRASKHEPGCDDEMIAVLEGYVSTAYPARQTPDGVRVTTLDDLILDQIVSHIASREYAEASLTSVLFTPDLDAEQPRLIAVPIPEGGSRQGACDYIRSGYPRAVILDEVSEETAVLLWNTLLR